MMQRSSLAWLRATLECLGVSLLLTALAFAATWPLAEHFNSAIPYRTSSEVIALNKPGDSLQLLYWFWLLQDNLFGASAFLHNPYEFNMIAGQPPDGLYMYPLNFLYLLFTPLGDIAAFNAVVICSYILTGLFTYLLVNTYTQCRAGALLAALIYTLVPLRISNLLGGHLNGFVYFLLPAILYSLEMCLRRASMWWGALSGLALLWLSLLEIHLIYYMCVLIGVYLPFRLLCFPSLVPDPQEEGDFYFAAPFASNVELWPLLRLFVVGAALTCFYQSLAAWKLHPGFITGYFWVALVVYPLLFVMGVALVAAIMELVCGLSFRQGLHDLSWAVLPFVCLPLYVFNHWLNIGHLDKVLGAGAVILVALAWWRKSRRWPGPCRLTMPWSQAGRLRLRYLLFFFMGLLLTITWVFFVKKVFFVDSIAQGGRTIQDVKLFSPALADLYTQGSVVYFGLVPLVLIGYLLVVLFRQIIRGREVLYSRYQLTFVCFFSTIFLLAYLLGSGLSLGTTSLYIFFFDYFPFFNYPRVPDRIMSVAFLSGSVLCAYAIRDIVKRFWQPGDRWFLAVCYTIFIGVLWLDYGAGKPVALTNLDRGQDIYTYVAENIGEELLLELPLWPGDSHQSSLYEYYTTMDRVHRVNGYTPIVAKEYVEKVYNPLSTLNMGYLDRQQYDLLKQMGVRFLTVHDNPEVFPRRVSPFPSLMTVRRLLESPYLERIDVDNRMQLPGLKVKNPRLYLFRVVDEPPEQVPEKDPCEMFMPRVYPGADLPHLTGQQEEDTKIGKLVLHAVPGRDREHYFTYGPYEEYPAGTYKVTYRLRTDHLQLTAPIVRLDVSTFKDHGTQEILAEKVVYGTDLQKGEYCDVTLQVHLNQLQRLEFRSWFMGKGEVYLEKIIVSCGAKAQPAMQLEAERQLGETGFVVDDILASSGKAVQALPGRDRSGKMIYGPNQTFAAGDYQVQFYVKGGRQELTDPENPDVVQFIVTSDDDAMVLAEKKVQFSQLDPVAYQPFALNFTVQRNMELSFVAYYNGQTDVQIDTLILSRKGHVRQVPLSACLLLMKPHEKKSTKSSK